MQSFPLIFKIPHLPDLSSQKYITLYGQGVRQKVLTSQKDFLLLFSDLSQKYKFTFSIRYLYLPDQAFDKRLGIYLIINQSSINLANEKAITQIAKDIEKIINQGFLKNFYQIERISSQSIGPTNLYNLNWVTHIAEAIKYEEIITKSSNLFNQMVSSGTRNRTRYSSKGTPTSL